MGRLFIARHGETDYNLAQRWQGTSDIQLNDRGRAQATALAARIRVLGLEVAAVGSSTLSRAYETAQIVAMGLGLPTLTPDVRLRERSFGVFEGLTYTECEVRFPEVNARYQVDPTAQPDGAEGYDRVVARVREAVMEATRVKPHSLLIAHGGVMRALVSSVHKEQVVPRIWNCALYELVVTEETIVSATLVEGQASYG